MNGLVADIRALRKRLREKPLMDLQQFNNELVNNLYPAMEALAEQIAEVDGVIQEVVEQQESYLHPEFAAVIMGALALGEELAKAVENLEVDDLTRKKLHHLVAAYRLAAGQAAAGVADATVFEQDEEDTEDGGEEDEAEDEGDDQSEEE